MKIYIDVIILENFIVNTFLLMITMKLTSHKYKLKNICVAGFIGSIYAMVMVIPQLKLLSILPVQILTAYIMITITCRKEKFLDRIRILVIFFISTFCLSGICLYISLKREIYILGHSYVIKNYSVKYIILAMMMLLIVFFRIQDYIKERIAIKSYIYDIEMKIEDEDIKIKGFLDTGNGMKETVTNLPCILVEKNVFSKINTEKYETYKILFNTVSESGSINGFRVNNIKIKLNGHTYRQLDAIVCPCNRKFNMNNEVDALIPRCVL